MCGASVLRVCVLGAREVEMERDLSKVPLHHSLPLQQCVHEVVVTCLHVVLDCDMLLCDCVCMCVFECVVVFRVSNVGA